MQPGVPANSANRCLPTRWRATSRGRRAGWPPRRTCLVGWSPAGSSRRRPRRGRGRGRTACGLRAWTHPAALLHCGAWRPPDQTAPARRRPAVRAGQRVPAAPRAAVVEGRGLGASTPVDLLGLTTLSRQGHLVRHDLVDGSREVAVYTSTAHGRREGSVWAAVLFVLRVVGHRDVPARERLSRSAVHDRRGYAARAGRAACPACGALLARLLGGLLGRRLLRCRLLGGGPLLRGLLRGFRLGRQGLAA